MRCDWAEIFFFFFFFFSFFWSHCEQLWYGQRCPPFDAVHPALSLPTTVLPTLKGALKDGFEEAVMARDITEPCKFPSLDSCQKRFMWTHKGSDLALHWVVSLALKVGPGDVWKFPPALCFKSLDPFYRVSREVPCFTMKGLWRPYSETQSIISQAWFTVLTQQHLNNKEVHCTLALPRGNTLQKCPLHVLCSKTVRQKAWDQINHKGRN